MVDEVGDNMTSYVDCTKIGYGLILCIEPETPMNDTIFGELLICFEELIEYNGFLTEC